MKTVLITRPKDQAGALMSALEQLGLRYELFPTIEIAPVSGWSCPSIESYSGIFFTSVNAARYFMAPLQRQWPEAVEAMKKVKNYAVGKKTAETLKPYGLTVEPLPQQAYGSELVAMLKPEEVNGNKYLFIRGSLSLGIVPAEIGKLGGTCDEVTVYENRPPDKTPEEKARIKSLLDQGEIDCIVFTSPSTVTNFFQILGISSLPPKVKVASIGDTTSAALQEFDLETNIRPSYSSGEDLADAIAAALN
ncbi:MAG: uroporphyrinogen-III synthase [Chlorobiales bacterium]|jgi:uroporphyrinogen-III synthase|nr:uroporphyrinogen-III synthase [Chlorobiales bacterium]